jgi:hypothetical protein
MRTILLLLHRVMRLDPEENGWHRGRSVQPSFSTQVVNHVI